MTHEWYEADSNFRLHRIGGPAIETSDGRRVWYLNGMCHRIGGPAIEYEDGSKAWLTNGLYHRTDGPAVELADGTKEWWVFGRQVTKKEFNSDEFLAKLIHLA